MPCFTVTYFVLQRFLLSREWLLVGNHLSYPSVAKKFGFGINQTNRGSSKLQEAKSIVNIVAKRVASLE